MSARLELDDLPPRYRAQAEKQLAQRRCGGKAAPASLEAAVNAARSTGHEFDSRGEYDYYMGTVLPKVQSGEVVKVELHRRFTMLPEEFWLPAGGLVGSEKKLRVLAERRDAAKMIVRFFAESLEEMEYTPEQIEAVKEEIKKNYQQFLGWVDDGGEEFAYDRLRRVIEDIYGVGAMVERVKGEEPVFGEPLFKKDF
jgi:hypothetical protein